ncbi:AvrD family protein [Lysinibacter sp. HNR]|uniref:AvrD family protein n=1 Tax=Lysinibacter sp. HNR TaxID=3031408 RepID=UPI002434FF07|nr:AvrD family protein [Lysinibacter sp. HNR]WGD37206.1 AvrD family protein [Lysinibacter sp. HNR]
MTIHSYKTFDECLGDRSTRYFGHGYKSVQQSISNLTIDHESSRVSGYAHVDYQVGWSQKRTETPLNPHLSSIDGVIIAVTLCEAFMIHAFGMHDEELQKAWVNKINVRAGTKPLTTLHQFAVEGQHVSSDNITETETVSLFACAIGTFKITLQIQHKTLSSTVQNKALEAYPQSMTSSQRIYGDLYKQTDYVSHRVHLDPAARTAAARLSLMEPDTAERSGLEASYRTSSLIIGAIIVAAQLSQVLLYKIDGLSREETDTLWMRKFDITVAQPQQDENKSAEVLLHARQAQVLDLRNLGVWRISDVAIENFCGASVRGSLAYRLKPPPAAGQPLTDTVNNTTGGRP